MAGMMVTGEFPSKRPVARSFDVPLICALNKHLPLVPHICVSESGQHWFRKWLIAYSAPSHFLNQCWVIVKWTLRNKLQWNFAQNTKLFIHENASENTVCDMAVILSRGGDLQSQWYNAAWWQPISLCDMFVNRGALSPRFPIILDNTVADNVMNM